jgi:hypothetical protein
MIAVGRHALVGSNPTPGAFCGILDGFGQTGSVSRGQRATKNLLIFRLITDSGLDSMIAVELSLIMLRRRMNSEDAS